jgi:hypothetical protein
MKSGFTFKKKEQGERVDSFMYFGCGDLDRILDFQ